jgi:hypothetical protein
MPVAKISGHGLLALACAVALLWGCLIGERLMLRNADIERVKVIREMEQLKRLRPTPVSSPQPASPRRPQVTVG